MAKSKLLSALAAEKGVDIKKVLQKRKQKESSRKARRAGIPDRRPAKPDGRISKKPTKKVQAKDELESDDDEEDWEEEEDSDEEGSLNALNAFIDGEAEEYDSEESDEEGKVRAEGAVVAATVDWHTNTRLRSTSHSSNTTKALPTPK